MLHLALILLLAAMRYECISHDNWSLHEPSLNGQSEVGMQMSHLPNVSCFDQVDIIICFEALYDCGHVLSLDRILFAIHYKMPFSSLGVSALLGCNKILVYTPVTANT